MSGRVIKGPVADGGQVDRGFHYLDAQSTPADDYREIGGAAVNIVSLYDSENGANADRLIIEPLLGGAALGSGHQVVATLEGPNKGLAQLIPAADIDPLADGESALLIDQGDGTYAAPLHAVGIAPGTTNVPLSVYVDGVDLGVNVTIVRRN